MIQIFIIQKMNIFEILANDTSNANSFFMTLSHSQRNWSSFKRIVQQFLQNPAESTLNIGKQYWE